MRHNLDFIHSVNGRQIRIVAQMDGLLPVGANGYRVQIWDAIITPNQQIISRFTISLNGQLYNWGDEVNEIFCTQNGLAEIIIAEGQEN